VFVGYGSGALGVINVRYQNSRGETMLDTILNRFPLEKNGPLISSST